MAVKRARAAGDGTVDEPSLRARNRALVVILTVIGSSLVLFAVVALILSQTVFRSALDPDDPLIHNGLGVVSHALGQSGRARTSFERALKLAPGMPDALENLRALQRDARPAGPDSVKFE